MIADITQSVEYLLGKEEAIGSNPIISSTTFMIIVFWVFQLCSLMDMYLTTEFIFDSNQFLEGNPIIASTGLLGLFIAKGIAAIAGFGLYLGGQQIGIETWKFNAALFFSASVYSGLMVWWAIALMSI